jgi:predicted TIM-barrel fold metal-dependent hydrolase
MTTATSRVAPEHPARLAIVDSDIHNIPPAERALYPYLSQRWQRHLEVMGSRACPGYLYPKGAPLAARYDAWPPTGGPPGSDLAFMREQLLDPWGLEYGILNCLFGPAVDLNTDFGAAMARALNDWQREEWLAQEPRLRASILVPFEDAAAAAAEIERLGDDPRFVQVLATVRTRHPMGQRMYWPIYEAAERHGLPVGLHFGGAGGNPITPCGWPSYYIEDHTGMMLAFQAHLVSLVCEGVFERFPGLRIALIEGGFAWVPPLMWRLDRSWKKLREEVPHLKRLPSEYVREHVRISTQPMEEPEKPGQLAEVIEQFGCDEILMFATDYPHWDFDAPDRALPGALPRELARKLLAGNARALYRGLG